jgi:hypothetical protein
LHRLASFAFHLAHIAYHVIAYNWFFILHIRQVEQTNGWHNPVLSFSLDAFQVRRVGQLCQRAEPVQLPDRSFKLFLGERFE